MKKRAKVIGLIVVIFILILLLAYAIIGNPRVFINNRSLKNAIIKVEGETVLLNDIVPFDWDTMYTFAPYESKESIEATLGFESNSIEVNNINEGMVHLILVDEQKIVASILGYSENLGYAITFSDVITFDENAQFKVEKENGEIILTYIG